MRHHLAALTALLAITAAGCGSVEADTPAGSGSGSSDTPSTATETTASGPMTIEDARGEEIELDAPATEVVGLEWGVVENLVSLGVMPVGVADVEGYTAWVSAAPLDEGVEDVGTRGEPSVDALVALDPDLVITTTDLAPNVIEQLEEFVPVLVVRAAAAERPIEQMRDNLTLVAEAVGRTEQAETLLADLDTKLTEGTEQLATAGLDGAAFTLADGWVEGNAVSIRAFTNVSLIGAVGEELGLDNAWELEGDPDYGLAITDVEGLTGLGDIQFVYYSNDVEENAYETLDGNAIWEGLPFVEADNVHRLPDGIWMFGGPASVEQFVDALVEVLTA